MSTELELIVSRLRNLGWNSYRTGKPELRLAMRCVGGPSVAVGRGVSIYLKEQDLDRLIAYLAADEYYAAKLKAVVLQAHESLTE